MVTSDLVFEGLRFAVLAGGFVFLVHRARSHDLQSARGWPWIVGGLGLLTLQAGLDVAEEIWAPSLFGADDLRLATENPLLLGGFLALCYGLVQWLPLPGKLEEARGELRAANERLEERVKQRTEDLRSEKAFSDHLLETSPVGITVVNRDGTITYANDHAEAILGIEGAQEAGRSYKDPAWKIEAPGGGPFPEDQLPFARLKGGEDSVEGVRHAIRHPDGERRLLSVNGSAVRNDDGTFQRGVFAIEDVTEEHQAKRALAESEQRFREIAENLDAAVWLTEVGAGDPENAEVLYVSHQVEELFDLPVEAIEENPMSFLESVHPDDRQRVQEAIGQLDPQDPGFELEYRVQHGNGTVRHLQTRGVPIRDEEGRPVRLTGITQDITELRETERRLREKQKQLDTILEKAPMVLFAIDEEGRFTLSTGRGLESLDLEPGEAVGSSVEELYKDHPEVLDAVDRALEGEEVLARLSVGGSHWQVQMTPRPEAEDGKDGVIGVALDVTETVEARREAEREEHRYRQLLKTVPLCIVQIDEEGRFAFANEQASDVLGLSPSQVVGRNYDDPDWEIRDLAGDPIPAEELPFRKVRDEGEVVKEERHTIRWPDGTEHVLSVHGAPVFDEDGEVESTVFALGDVTEQLEREREIALERHLRAALFEENTDPIIEFEFVDGTPKIRAANDAFREVFRYEDEQVRGRPIAEMLVPPEGQAEHEDIAKLVRSGESVRTEVERLTASGSRRFLLHAIPVTVPDRGPSGYAWYTDVTELRKLQREEHLKARMLEEVGQAVIATDADGEVTYWNSHAEQMYGYGAEEAIGQDIMELTVPDTSQGRETAEEIMETIAEGQSWTGEFDVRRKDGTTFPAIVSDAPILDEDGELEGVIGVSYDISDIKDAQRKLAAMTNQLRARSRELRELSQAAAHGFRTPIWDMVRYLELLEREAGEQLDREEREHLETALDGARRLHDIVEGLQEYLDTTTTAPTLEECDLGEVAQLVLASMQEEIEASQAQITVEEPAPTASADPDLVAEVFTHLLENALRFSGDDPPHVEVGFEREGDVWVVSVEDEGVGIDPQYHERVFRPFRTLHSPAEGAGAGLGLAICRGIVESHGGTMWVRSAPNEGATFYLTLPAAGAPTSTRPSALLDDEEAMEEGVGVFEDVVELFEN